MALPIYDLHCDLLCYLERSTKRTENDPDSKCSIPLLKEGGVVFQTLAIFNETKSGSAKSGMDQFELYLKLLKTRSKEVFPLTKKIIPITIVPAIENASGLLEETGEKLDLAFKRLEKMQKEAGIILYISLTWNSENRFGGGNASSAGLKKDGEALLDFIDGKKIAIDFSHTSDRLAHDLINYIDKKNLKIQPIASHSNYRSIAEVPRNLPDEIAREIIRRKGVIGMNFVASFIGNDPSYFYKQIEHALSLGGKDAICLGADFFSEIDTPPELEHFKPFFFPGFDNSSCYSHAFDFFRKKFPEEILERIAYKNLDAFITRAVL